MRANSARKEVPIPETTKLLATQQALSSLQLPGVAWAKTLGDAC